MIVYIITEESFRNEARIVAVFSSEEAAEEFLFENEGDGETTLCVEEWSVDEELL